MFGLTVGFRLRDQDGVKGRVPRKGLDVIPLTV